MGWAERQVQLLSTAARLALLAGAEAGQVLVVTGDEVLVSADGGRTFTPLQSGGR